MSTLDLSIAESADTSSGDIVASVNLTPSTFLTPAEPALLTNAVETTPRADVWLARTYPRAMATQEGVAALIASLRNSAGVSVSMPGFPVDESHRLTLQPDTSARDTTRCLVQNVLSHTLAAMAALTRSGVSEGHPVLVSLVDAAQLLLNQAGEHQAELRGTRRADYRRRIAAGQHPLPAWTKAAATIKPQRSAMHDQENAQRWPADVRPAAAAAVGCSHTSPHGARAVEVREPLRDVSRSAAAGLEALPGKPSPSLANRTADKSDFPFIALVAFGVRAKWIALDPRAPLPPLGTVVVVPGDRGKDIGFVVEHGVADGGPCDVKWRSQLPRWRIPLAAPQKPSSVPGAIIIRLATAEEAASAHRLWNTFLSAMIPHVQAIVNEHAARSGDTSFASFRVQGVEPQDWFGAEGKITVYYSANADLRTGAVAVRLFQEFKCRVWLKRVKLDATPQPLEAASPAI